MNRMKLYQAAVVAAILAVTSAEAHESSVGPNGGPVVEAKGYHLELVVKGRELAVHLTDAANAAVASTGASGKAVILSGKTQLTVPLTPREASKLAGTLSTPVGSGARVVVSAKLATGQDLLARFVLQ